MTDVTSRLTEWAGDLATSDDPDEREDSDTLTDAAKEIARLRTENERLRGLLRDTLAREAALESKLPRQDTDAARDRQERISRLIGSLPSQLR